MVADRLKDIEPVERLVLPEWREVRPRPQGRLDGRYEGSGGRGLLLGLLGPVAAGVDRLHEGVGGRAGNGSPLLGEGPPFVITWGAGGDIDSGPLQAHSDILHW